MSTRSSPRILPHEILLHVHRQRRRNAVGIDERIVEPLGLKKDLVRVAVRKTLHLVLDRGTVARAPALDRAGKQGRPIEIRRDDVVRARIRPRDRAARAAAAECRRRAPTCVQTVCVARLLLEPRPVDGAAVEPRRRPGFQPALPQADLANLAGQRAARTARPGARPRSRSSPMNMRASRNVPVAITTARHRKRATARLDARDSAAADDQTEALR